MPLQLGARAPNTVAATGLDWPFAHGATWLCDRSLWGAPPPPEWNGGRLQAPYGGARVG